MKRFEIYIDDYERLCIAMFDDVESEYENFILHGADSYDLIKKLASKDIMDFHKYRNRDEAIVEYKNCIINLNDYERLLKKRGMGPLTKSLKEYHENGNLRKHYSNVYSVSSFAPKTFTNVAVNNNRKETQKRNKNVKRKNKYKGRIVAGSMCLLLLIGGLSQCSYQDVIAKQTGVTNWEEALVNYENIDNGYQPTNFFVEETENQKPIILMEYEDRSTTEKAYITKAYYGDLIEKFAKQYGLDSKLVLAIATQERGIHSTKRDSGGATGLMQIQNVVWEDTTIQAHNFNKNKSESIYITRDMIKDISSNIKIGCMYLQNCMEYMNYNVVAAVQCYNMGYGNMMKILNAYSMETNKSIETILADSNDLGWLKYRKNILEGDQNYVENVFSWIGSNTEINIKTSENTTVVTGISNEENQKNILI